MHRQNPEGRRIQSHRYKNLSTPTGIKYFREDFHGTTKDQKVLFQHRMSMN